MAETSAEQQMDEGVTVPVPPTEETKVVEDFVKKHCVAAPIEENKSDDKALPAVVSPTAKDRKQANQKPETKSLGSTVANHYNQLYSAQIDERKESRIYHLRNFNNWIKSVMINEFMDKLKKTRRVSDDINVLDLACGKGGDLKKWKMSGCVDHVIMTDIAEVSIEQCKERYAKLKHDQFRQRNYNRNNNYREQIFTAEFFAADSTKTEINTLYRRKNLRLDLSSCQFALHYSFESYNQVDTMLKNLCQNLRVGGYFIGTTPDAQKLVKRIKMSDSDSFGNSVFNIKPECKPPFPLFGSKYFFHLEGVVDCPEFIVYFPLLEKMAAKYNMKLVWKKNFHAIFAEYEKKYKTLLNKMSVLEKYPSSTTATTATEEGDQYKSARDHLSTRSQGECVGTLSADEWEVIGLYIGFAFEKVDPEKEIIPMKS